MRFEDLPNNAFLRKPEIVRTRGTPGIVPHGRTDWDKKVKAGIAPQPKFPLGPHAPLWTAGDLRAYLAWLNEQAARTPEQTPAGRKNVQDVAAAEAAP